MGVDLETWCETLRKHPLKYRFDGLGGWHTNVREAAVHDERFMNDYMYEEAKSIEEHLESDFLEPYCDYLICKLRVGHHDKELIDRCHAPAYTSELLEELEEELGEHRFEFACQYTDPQWAWECIRDNEGGEEHLLEKHPPVEVWNEAYGCGFPLERVVYICPSCGRQAMTIDELRDNGGRHYCSLCGSEYLNPHCFTKDPQELFQFWWDLGIKPWPFVFPGNVGELCWWEDPDGNEERSGWRTITGINASQRTVTLDHGTDAPFDEVIPIGVWEELIRAEPE